MATAPTIGQLVSTLSVDDLTSLISVTVRRAMRAERKIEVRDAKVLAPTAPLTAREMEVLALVVDGLENPQIGDALGVSKETVKNNINALLEKAGESGVMNRTALAVWAIRSGTVR